MVPDPQNYVVILRFLGTTPGTSNIVSTYQSVIYQLERIFNLTPLDRRLNTKISLKEHLYSQLVKLSIIYPEKTIVIFLDSIDQLSSSDYNCDW